MTALAHVAIVAALLAIVGIAALVTLVGAVVAVVATPGDRPVEIPARPAGIGAACLGVLVFLAAATILADFLA